MARRREISAFNLSFLDVMFCGFGAVVLLVMLLNGRAVAKREEIHADLRGEVVAMEKQVLEGRRNQVEANNALTKVEEEITQTQGKSNQVIRRIDQSREEIANMKAETLASIEHINRLKSDLKALEEGKKRMGSEINTPQDGGNRVRQVRGEGQRQYLTGLKLEGKRTLILLDRSASMLDSTIVNIVRRKITSAAERRRAPKWQRALKTMDWLVANLPVESKYQVVSFGPKADTVLPETQNQWLEVKDTAKMTALFQSLRKLAPEGGTSLHKAFASSLNISPRPDNIILITDGLPTHGSSAPGRSKISSEQRFKFYQSAVKQLAPKVPVNTILFPMEGDPLAAGAFWKLAIDTKGSFMTPTRDWP